MMADVSVQAADLDACLDQTAVRFIDKPHGGLALILEDRGQRKLGALAGAWRREMHRRRLAERDGGVRLYAANSGPDRCASPGSACGETSRSLAS